MCPPAAWRSSRDGSRAARLQATLISGLSSLASAVDVRALHIQLQSIVNVEMACHLHRTCE